MQPPRRSAPPRTDAVIGEERFQRYHAYAREHGVNRFLYMLARLILQPVFLVWFRWSRTGREHLRGITGGLIVASNHRSFLDPFVIGATLPWRRPMQYVAKVELFERRWQGWLLSRVGAFPIRRGQSDDTAMQTARLALERGGTVPRTEHPSPGLAATVTDRIWPNIELQWEWLGGLPPLRKAAVIGAGSWGTAMAVLLARGGLDVQLGTRSQEKAEEIAAKRGNPRYLPGVALPEAVAVKRATDIELAGVDLVCLAVPSTALPTVVGSLGDRVGSRAAVLMLTKGLVRPLGQLPSDYVGERIRTRAIASLGGPAHAREAAAGMAALVLGSTDADLRAQLGEVFDRAGLVCERSADVVGVEMAGVAKNAAALAAAAAEPHGLNAAGIAAATIWRECVDYAIAGGAQLETFTGLAGVGDLTATVLAPGSRNRRAGGLLGGGMPAEQIPGKIGQASEGLDSVPLIAESVARAGIDAPGLDGLTALIEGSIEPGEWVAGLRRAERARRAA